MSEFPDGYFSFVRIQIDHLFKLWELNQLIPVSVIYLATIFPIYILEIMLTFRPTPANSPIYPEIWKNQKSSSVHVVDDWSHIPLGITYFWGVIHKPALVTIGSLVVLGGFTTPMQN